ncbi:hypothetical protein CsSME_00046696 [Camellia sinensis var. sinensis]
MFSEWREECTSSNSDFPISHASQLSNPFLSLPLEFGKCESCGAAEPGTCEVYADGSICLDILQNQWSPIYDIVAILTSIQSMLCDPNANSPANSEAALLFCENKREYNRRVREIVEQSWTED